MTITDKTQSLRHNQAFWQQHTDQWKQSGLSKIAYSQQHNLKPASFYNWSKKRDNAGPQRQRSAHTPPSFVPVQIDHSAANSRDTSQFVHVERTATDIALPVNLTSEQIQHWLTAIYALHV